AYVNRVRDDGKIDLLLYGRKDGRVDSLAGTIRERLSNTQDRFLPLCDSSSPEEIRAVFSCSKKDFKKAIGSLYREHVISLVDGGIKLN
ncbi:MAG: GntR family transcriptional regulator, partial [Duncaniella sp.]|nr:GntR family transcriptional regulator [Duncaniella sp.]